MKKFKFSNGKVITANTKEDAISKYNSYKVTANYTIYEKDIVKNTNITSLDKAKKLVREYTKKGIEDLSIVDTKTNKIVPLVEEYLVVPVTKVINKTWLLNYKHLLIEDSNKAKVFRYNKTKLKVTSIPKLIQLIRE